MLRPSRPAAILALALTACPAERDPGGEGTSTGSTGAEPSTGEAATSTGGESSSGNASTGEGSTSSSGSSSTGEGSSSTTEPTAVCGDAVVGGDEQCDDGKATVLCDDNCTLAQCGDGYVNEAAGEQCDDGNASETDGCLPWCTLATCGDGCVEVGVEECDDGNAVNSDGCTACAKDRWTHFGVAHDVPIADLHLWKQCWLDAYDAGTVVDSLGKACTGDHIMIACKKAGSDTLELAAHAPRADVFLDVQVDPDAGKRHQANGVSWYWSPYYGLAGFGPGGSATSCFVDGENDQLCWRVGGNMPLAFTYGRRCGPAVITDDVSAAKYQRVVFQSWD